MRLKIILASCLVMSASYTSLFAAESRDAKKTAPVVMVPLEGVEWVKLCIQRYPELHWLADQSVRKTEEGTATSKQLYSEQLFGQKFIEFDRTIMSLHCLRLILDGSDAAYASFTEGQPESSKLSKEEFHELNKMGSDLINAQYAGISKAEMVKTIESALVLGDIGKSSKARVVFKAYGVSAPDHDDFAGETMAVLANHPKLCPSFYALSPASRKLLQKIANLIHYGHVTHLEGGPDMFSKIKQSGLAAEDPFALKLDQFIHRCDVAGAAGHVSNRGSLVYTRTVHQNLKSAEKACWVLSDPTKTEEDAYADILETQAKKLKLDPKIVEERVLTRVGSLLRLSTPEDGERLKKALHKFNDQEHALVLKAFDTYERGKPTPTYVPAVLVNLYNLNPSASQGEKLEQAMKALPFLARVQNSHRKNIALNFNPVAGVVKMSPDLLESADFEIDREGNVTVVVKR